jgi:hypothetical protein
MTGYPGFDLIFLVPSFVGFVGTGFKPARLRLLFFLAFSPGKGMFIHRNAGFADANHGHSRVIVIISHDRGMSSNQENGALGQCLST